MPDDAQSDELFSRVYLREATRLRDSQRFRRRIFAGFSELLSRTEVSDFSSAARQRLGVAMSSAEYASQYEAFFLKAEVRDVLDSISIINAVLKSTDGWRSSSREDKKQPQWRTFVQTVFEEESLGYVLNKNGGVRYAVDEEYERNRFSVIDGLGDSRYAAVKHAVENSFAKLDGKVDTKAAVREMFEAAEILAKLMADVNEDERMVQKRIKPIAQRLYSGKPSEISFADQMLEGFAKWVNAGHKYRHGQKTEEPVAPPLDMAVAYLSAGASHIRFLTSVDATARMLS